VNTSTRILLGFLLVVTAGFYFLLDKLTDRVERQYLEAAEEPMVDTAHILASWLEEEFAAREFNSEKLRRIFHSVTNRRFEAHIYKLTKNSVDMNVYVTDAQGIVLFDSRDPGAEGQDYSKFNDVFRTLRGAYGARSTRISEEDELSSIMYVGAPIRRGQDIIGMVSVIKPQASMFEFVAETKRQISLYLWTILLATILAAILISHWFSRPMRKLTDYARAVRRGVRAARPRLAGSDARTLGQALEEMRDSLEDRKYVESYVQTLTHEMKSPVAAIHGAAELLQESSMPLEQRNHFLENIQIETNRLENIIDRLLALSAIESMKTLENPVDIDLTELVDHVCLAHAHLLEARQICLRKQYDARPLVHGETFLLEIALGNLLQNAIDFSPNGGTITISLKPISEKTAIELAVQDEGPGIPDYAMSKVFDRFYSLQHPSTGKKSSGLGLCFVREAAELHGGTAHLENRPGQTGARAVLRIQMKHE
jgi:two-component system sensor histidine kinase CreC